VPAGRGGMVVVDWYARSGAHDIYTLGVPGRHFEWMPTPSCMMFIQLGVLDLHVRTFLSRQTI